MIRHVQSLQPRSGVGAGFSVEIENQSDEQITVSSTSITGRVAKSVQGAASQHIEVAFHVELDSHVSVGDERSVEITGAVYSSPVDEWGALCTGRFEHEDSTAHGHQRWTYHFNVPTRMAVPAGGRSVLRLLFRRKAREQFLFTSEGFTPAMYVSGFLYRDHDIRLVLEDGSEVVQRIEGEEFLILIANWE
jgi:hypothetical protein